MSSMGYWQDIVMMVAGFVFAPSLIISIKKKSKIPLGTSLPTAIALSVLTFCVATLGLYLAALADGLTAICWFILVWKR